MSIVKLLNPVTATHPIHLSLCEIHHNPVSKKLEISLKIFTDDLEEALLMQGIRQLFIATEKEKEGSNEYIFKYIQGGLSIMEKGQKVRLNWVGKELSDDLMAVWCYMESEPVSVSVDITFKNCILMELFSDQKNIVHAHWSDRKKQHELFTYRQCR
jgi:hypothetical protein